MTKEQQEYIAANLGKMKQYEIAKAIGISKWKMSRFMNKRREYKVKDGDIFRVELPLDHTWII